jgi:hypothetical protein
VIVVSLVVAVLAVARITRFLTEDFLAVGYRRWVVNRWGEDSKMSYLVHCPWCTSIWVAIPVMPIAALFPNVWVIAAFSIPAASMVSGLLSSSKE